MNPNGFDSISWAFCFGEPRLLSLFSNAGEQTEPICFSSKGRSGVRGKAYIEGCAIVSRGNVEVLFWPKHPRGMPVRRHRRTHAHQERFGMIHVRPSWWPPPNQTSGINPDCFQEMVRGA
jgi:hypothetical protein